MPCCRGIVFGEDAWDDHDPILPLRGWAVRGGHRRRLLVPRPGVAITRGRAVYARSQNSSNRRVCRMGGSFRGLKKVRGTQARTQRRALWRDIREMKFGAARSNCSGEADSWAAALFAGDDSVDQHCLRDTTFVSELPIVSMMSKSKEEGSKFSLLQPCVPKPLFRYYEPSLWDMAVARASRAVGDYIPAVKAAVWTVAAVSHPKPSLWDAAVQKYLCDTVVAGNKFETLRKSFLKKYGKHIRENLGHILEDPHLIPAPLAPGVQQQFLTACSSGHKWTDELPCNLRPAIHGTNAALFDSIFARGLLIPGQGNDLHVVHGSACGLGIYTTNPENAATSRSYCTVPRMLICGLLDTEDSTVKRYNWGWVIFDACLVAPLFEVSAKTWNVQPYVMPIPATVAPGRATPWVPPVYPQHHALKSQPPVYPQPRAPKAVVAPLDGARAFLARRPARRRRS